MQPDERQAEARDQRGEPLGDPLRAQRLAVLAGEHAAGIGPARPPGHPLCELGLPPGSQRVCRGRIDRDDAVAVLALGFVQTGERHLERFKGAGAVGDWADAIWLYTKGSDGIRNLAAEGRARISFAETGLGYYPASRMLWLTGGDWASRERGALRPRITEAVRREPGITADKLCAVAGGHKATAREAMDQMLAEGLLRNEHKGAALKWFATDQPRP